jgi:hypothetical protein
MRRFNLGYMQLLILSLCGCLSAASIGQPTSALAGDPASTLVVDASQPVTLSDSGDDLATVKNLFQDANAPQDGAAGDATDPRRQIISDIGMKRMRILQGDVYCDLDDSGAFGNRPLPNPDKTYPPVVPGDCDLMKWEIDWALLSGLAPHVAVAYYMPQSFVQYGPAETWSSEILLRYQSYAQQLVRKVVSRSFDGGASSVVFEVSNELDLNDPYPLGYLAWLAWLNNCPNPCVPSSNPVVLGFPTLGPWGRALWWMDPSTFNLTFPGIWDHQAGYPFYFPPADDMRRLTRGIGPMQKIFADAVVKVGSDAQFMAPYQGKTIQIAGPALAGATFTRAEDATTHAPIPTLEETFIDYMFNSNSGPVLDPNTKAVQSPQPTQLDYFSFHYYGDFHNGAIASAPATTTLKYITDRIRAKLGTSGTKLFLSEWGPTVDLTTDINYSNKGAAWTAAFLTEAVADHIAMGSYLILDDFVGGPPTDSGGNVLTSYAGDLTQASLTHKVVNNSVATYYPKPPANVFKMFAMMTGTRNAVTIPTGMPNLGAFAASDSTSASVLVFNYPYDYSFTDTPLTFSVELDNLPFNGPVTVNRYLVDAKTSNLEAFLYPNQTNKTDPTLQQVETFTAQVTGGQLTVQCCAQAQGQGLGLGVTFWRISQ